MVQNGHPSVHPVRSNSGSVNTIIPLCTSEIPDGFYMKLHPFAPFLDAERTSKLASARARMLNEKAFWTIGQQSGQDVRNRVLGGRNAGSQREKVARPSGRG